MSLVLYAIELRVRSQQGFRVHSSVDLAACIKQYLAVETPARFERAIIDLQSTALPAWLWRHIGVDRLNQSTDLGCASNLAAS